MTHAMIHVSPFASQNVKLFASLLRLVSHMKLWKQVSPTKVAVHRVTQFLDVNQMLLPVLKKAAGMKNQYANQSEYANQ